MERVYNFAAGPACLPEEVLKKAQAEFLVYGNSGMNVMEMSHRSKDFLQIITEAEADLRTLLKIPEELQGAVFAGRRIHTVCGGALKPCAKRQSAFCKYRQLVQKSHQRGQKIPHCKRCGQFGRQDVHLYPLP